MTEERIALLEQAVAKLQRKMANTRKRTEILKQRLNTHREEEHKHLDKLPDSAGALIGDIPMIHHVMNRAENRLAELEAIRLAMVDALDGDDE